MSKILIIDDDGAVNDLLVHVAKRMKRMPFMQFMIYAAPFNLIGRHLHNSIQSVTVDAQSTYCTSLRALETFLRNPMGFSPIGILIPSNDGELAALIGMRHLLRDMRLILILPENHAHEGAHSRAHMLRPRFISYANGDLSDVTAVLKKMNAKNPSNRPVARSSGLNRFNEPAIWRAILRLK